MTEETVLAPAPAETPIPHPADLVIGETPTPEAPAKEVEATPEPETADVPAQDETTEERKNVPGSQKLKRRLQLIEADFEAERNTRVELERRLQSFQQPQQPEGRPGIDREPKETDYPNDYFAWQNAQTAWNARQAVREEFARVQQQQNQSQNDRQRREVAIERREAYDDNAKLARERIDDFDKVIAAATDIKITNEELVEEIMSSEKAAMIHYYLAKNPDKARELNGLKGKELAREVGRLEARVHLPQAKKATEASPPPSQPKGGAAAPVNLETASMDDFVRIREEQIKRRSSR